MADIDQPRRPHGLSDPEVRALASRYGNRTRSCARISWHPSPGFNVRGRYDDYGSNPGAYWEKWAKDIADGTSPYLKP